MSGPLSGATPGQPAPARVVIAPDKFKGSLSAEEVAAHLARGLAAAVPGVVTDEIPVADGGDGTVDAALAAVTELTESRNPYRVRALEELAKHYEHRERDYVAALEMTSRALGIEDTPEMRRREERLKGRVDRRRPRRLVL